MKRPLFLLFFFASLYINTHNDVIRMPACSRFYIRENI